MKGQLINIVAVFTSNREHFMHVVNTLASIEENKHVKFIHVGQPKDFYGLDFDKGIVYNISNWSPEYKDIFDTRRISDLDDVAFYSTIEKPFKLF